MSDYTDLVHQLRETGQDVHYAECLEAADAIEALCGAHSEQEVWWQRQAQRMRQEKEEAQREGLRLIGLLRERDDTLAAVREWAVADINRDLPDYKAAQADILAILDGNDTDE